MAKTALVTKIMAEHAKLDDALTGLSLEQMDKSFKPGDWTVKETLVHLSAWEQTLINDHRRWKRGEPLTELQGQAAVDAVNAETLKKAGMMPVGQALGEFHSTFRELTAWLEKLDPDDLPRLFMYGMTLEEFIAEDTYKHYAEHLYLINQPGSE